MSFLYRVAGNLTKLTLLSLILSACRVTFRQTELFTESY